MNSFKRAGAGFQVIRRGSRGGEDEREKKAICLGSKASAREEPRSKVSQADIGRFGERVWVRVNRGV